MANNKAVRILVVGIGTRHITFLDNLVNGLASSGIHLYLASPEKPRKGRFHPRNVHWVWTPRWKSFPLLWFLNLVVLLVTKLLARRLPWLLSSVNRQPSIRKKWSELYRLLPFVRGRWDLIYFPWNAAAIGYQALYHLGLPVVVSCRGNQINIRPMVPRNQSFSRELKRSLQGATTIHCVSQDILQEATHIGLIPSRAVVIRPAVDTRFFSVPKNYADRKGFTILTTGNLIWVKGYEYALLAFRRLLDKGLEASFQIIGEGPERQRIMYTLHDLGLEGRVVLHGRLPPDRVRDNLHTADVFLFSSLSEGISNAVLEAMSCGLPVVTSDCGGMREVVTDGIEGFVVPLRDPVAMADKLQLLAEDPTLRIRMGNAGRERILKEFDQQEQVKNFVDMFFRAAGKP